jgi:tetratricopeptide (TPR) repeat protein
MGHIATRSKAFLALARVAGATIAVFSAFVVCQVSEASENQVRDERAGPLEETRPGTPPGGLPLRAESDLAAIALQWAACRKALAGGDLKQIQYEMDRLYDAKLDAGFRNQPDVAALLVRHGYLALEKGEIEKAVMLGKAAKNMAPDFYPASFFLSKAAMAGPARSMLEAAGYLWDGMTSMRRSFLWEFYAIGSSVWAFIISTGCLFALFVIYLLWRHVATLAHEYAGESSGGKGLMPAYAGIGVFLSLMFLLLPRLLYWAILAIFLTAPFHRRWEKRCVAGSLLGMCLLPGIFQCGAVFLLPLPRTAEGLLGVGQGTWGPSAEEALVAALRDDPDDVAVLWALGLVHKRRGDYRRAEWFYRRALERDPGEPRLWNNLGNLYYVSERLDDAKDAYSKAIDLDTRLCAPHYNLSQILRREFFLSEGTEEFEKARSLDPQRVHYFLYIHAPHPNRVVIDEEPPTTMVWKKCLQSGEQRLGAARDLWNVVVGDVPYSRGPLFLVCLSVLYLSYAWWVGQRPAAFRCQRCGSVVTSRSQPESAGEPICGMCYQALYQRDHIPHERRHAHLQRISRSRIRTLRRSRLTNLLFPGIGYVVYEDGPRGFLYLFVFLAWASWLAVRKVLVPPPSAAWPHGAGTVTLLAAALGVVFYVSLQVTLARRLKR